MTSELVHLPAVHRIMALPTLDQLRRDFGQLAVREAVRAAVAEAREAVRGGHPAASAEALAGRAAALLALRQDAYRPLINATGVLVHTNLGRAPLLPAALPAYLALEMDLDSGARSERLTPVTDRLTRYFGAEAAVVVTNNAAALVLLMAAHAAGREVLVSRGELIEIGGSFRLPEIVAASGAQLVEVGCTNRTRRADYEQALTAETAAMLVCHRSNFFMSGFVESPRLEDLVALGNERGVGVWVDQGSGCHLDLERFGLGHEPTVRELLAAGPDAVLFSGDKLLGGPQAGILLGRRQALEPLQRHPLRRALRPDKSVLLTLAATLDAYLAGHEERVPLYRLLGTREDQLKRRAALLARRARHAGLAVTVMPTRAVLGGGTTPDQTLPSFALAVPGGDALAARLRRGTPAVVPRIEEGLVLLDLRAVFPEQDALLLGALETAVGT
jgi:L-seryl-tRNA(Ser) seleniumtransferase